MKRQQHPRANPAGRADGQTDQTTTRRFKTLYGKPKSLTDRYDECREEDIARVLQKPEAELGFDDFTMLYRVGVASASYEEGLYFLPEAFAFLRRNPDDDGIQCVADVMWFISEHAARLEADGLLEECQEQVEALLGAHTSQFVVIHWDREKNRQMGWDREHHEYVKDSQLVCDAVEALLRFQTLAPLALTFLETLSQAENDPLKSAWFLTFVAETGRWALFRKKSDPPGSTRCAEALCAAMPELGGIWAEFQKRGLIRDCPDQLSPDPALLERHATVIRRSGELFTEHPTHWLRLFGKLGLDDAAKHAAAAADFWTRRNQLIRDIEAAFRDVDRGHGPTLHEAVAFEGTDYCTAEERAYVRALDPETRWQDIPDAALKECVDRWAFDDEGFRFHLPAYLRWHLRHLRGLPPGCGGMLFLQLSITGHKPQDRLCSERSFDRFPLEQKRVIARFLEFMALEGGSSSPATGATELDAQIAQDAERAWQTYWFQFSHPARRNET